MKRFFVVRILIITCITSCLLVHDRVNAQSEKKIEVFGTPFLNKDVFVIGEIHSNFERNDFVDAAFNYLHEQYNVNNLVMEFGVSLAYLYNSYLVTGDTSIFRYTEGPRARKRIEELSTLNRSLSPEKHIKVYGIDFERMEFITAVKLILSKNPGTERTELYKYIQGLPDSLCDFNDLTKAHSKLRKETYNRACTIFGNEKDNLKLIVRTDFDVLQNILENPSTEQHFAKRDKGMFQNAKKQLEGKKYLCVLGMYHVMYQTGDIHSSFLKRLVRSQTKCTVIMEVCKHSYSTTQWFHGTEDTGRHIYPASGPKQIINNEAAMALAFSKYYKPGYFSLVNEAEFKDQGVSSNHDIPTYYAFFDYPALK